jgi:hypothetical protein
MANIINHIDRADAWATKWLLENHPTFIFRFIAGASWSLTAMGVYLVGLSYWSHTAYDVFAGLILTIAGSVASTMLTLWAHNEIADIRKRSRRNHPSYPYKSK